MNYVISDKESKLINIIKLISILLVLYIHAFSSIEYVFDSNNILFNIIKIFEYVITEIVARAGVPLFFLISSLLLYRKKYKFKENIKKKVKRLLIPYLIINTIWIIVFLVFQNIEYSKNLFSNDENNIGSWNILNWFDAYIPIFFREKPFVYPLWFLKDLFLLNCFSIVIKKIIDKIPKLFFIVILGMWFFNIKLGIIESQSLLFFSIGYYIVKYNIRFHDIKKINFFIVSIIYFILASVLAYFEILYSKLFIIHSLFIFISMFYIYILANNFIFMSKNKVINTLIKKSYFIYLFHEWNMLFVKKIMDKLINNNYILDFIKYLCLPLIIILLCLIISIIWEKISKKTYKIATGE